MDTRKIARRAGIGALVTVAIAGYWVAAEHGGPYAAAAVRSQDPGGSVSAPGWLAFQRATAADKRHFHLRGQCVIELTRSGHGWIVCRDGESRPVPDVAEPHRITLVKAETGLALGSLKWHSASSAAGRLELTGEGAADIGKVRVTVRRSSSGALASLTFAGDIGGFATSWTFAHGHWNAG
jgi:hypothetical protein